MNSFVTFFLALPWYSELCLIYVFIGAGIYLIGFSSFFYYKSKKPNKSLIRNKAPGAWPKISIIKSCYLADDNEAENFKALLNQNYLGEFEILFSVSRMTDPVVPIIEQTIRENTNPRAKPKLVLSNTRKACWLKIDALYDAHKVATGEIIIWSDSDAFCKPDYLEDMAASLMEKDVSVVSTPQFDIGTTDATTALKSLGNNCDVGLLVSGYDILTPRRKAAFGHSIGFYKKEFDSFGDAAWETLNNAMADDFGLPYLFTSRGKRVVFRNIYCPVHFEHKSFKQIADQKKRWSSFQRAIVAPWRFLYIIAFVGYPVAMSFLNLILLPSVFSASIFLVAFLVRLTCSYLTQKYLVEDTKPFFKYWYTILGWDLLQFYFIFWAIFNTKMIFNGKNYRVVNRFFVEEIISAQ